MTSHPARISEAFRCHIGVEPNLTHARSMPTNQPSNELRNELQNDFSSTSDVTCNTASADDHFTRPDQPAQGVTDLELLEDMIANLFSHNISYRCIPLSLSIAYTCSSLGSAYAYVVPRILSHYLYLAHGNLSFQALQNMTASVVHVIPQHKAIRAESFEQSPIPSSYHSIDGGAAGFSSSNSSSGNSTPRDFPFEASRTATTFESFNGVYDIHSPGNDYCIFPKNSVFPPATMASLLKNHVKSPQQDPSSHQNYSYGHITLSPGSTPAFNLPQSPSSPSLSPIAQSPSLLHTATSENDDMHWNINMDDRIFNTFAFIPRRKNALVVPPNSANFNFALYPLPSHVLPSFQHIIQARYEEILPSGLMVVCYPTSLALYHNFILPCLDLALHQMLALNMISTQACEAITIPPSSPIYSFETQRTMIEQLPNSEILYFRNIEDYSPSEWGYRWISEDMHWIRQTLAGLDVSSQSIIKLINILTRNPLWSAPASCDISMFIVRKQSFS